MNIGEITFVGRVPNPQRPEDILKDCSIKDCQNKAAFPPYVWDQVEEYMTAHPDKPTDIMCLSCGLRESAADPRAANETVGNFFKDGVGGWEDPKWPSR